MNIYKYCQSEQGSTMYNSNELRFLCEAFSKCRVGASLHRLDDKASDISKEQFPTLLSIPDNNRFTLRDFIGELSPQTLYKITNRFSLCYNFLLLPDDDLDVLLIGPYLSSPLSPAEILEISEKNSIPPASQKFINEFYTSIPVLSPDDRIFAFLSTFCEHLWDTPSYSIVDYADRFDGEILSAEAEKRNDFDQLLVGMKMLEKRYGFENELMEAVTQGRIQKERELLGSFSENHFERRLSDPIRNAKNYAIIMNTLLRKAAEKGGVHPMYLDRMSSDFAAKIEALASLSDNYELMLDMFRSYCKLVRKYSMQGLSPIVRKTVLMIDADLSADLSLGTIAAAQNVSSGYLSTIFKKETGKTVSEYIREKRIRAAQKLLSTTHLQVQTIALHCGILDVQYFTKLFKKTTGMSPKEYREYTTNANKYKGG